MSQDEDKSIENPLKISKVVLFSFQHGIIDPDKYIIEPVGEVKNDKGETIAMEYKFKLKENE